MRRLPATSRSPTKRRRPTPVERTDAGLNPSSPAINTLNIRNDRLGTLVRSLASAFASSASWESFIQEYRGPSYLSSELDQVDHPAAALLRRWRDEGVPVHTSSPPWTLAQKDACIQRGCHKSAKDHSSFLREELAEFMESKSWMVLPYRLVRHLEALMFSPAAVKEERERKPRLLCDHSWPWLGWPSVNETTIPHAPPEAMQFGRALHRLLAMVRHANPKFGPVRAAKYDIKDGFYRLFLRPSDCLRLSLVLPAYENEEQLVAIPLACTMGWVQSPPTFCAMSETVCDLANRSIRLIPSEGPPTHRLDDAAAVSDDLSYSWEPRPKGEDDAQADERLRALPSAQVLPSQPYTPAPPSNCAYNKPLGATDVFVDDFLQLGQGGPDRMKALRRCLLHAVDDVLALPSVTTEKRNEAVSLKKLLKGDGSWATRKVILGWILDTIRQTIELPPHRKQLLADIFHDLASKRRISEKKYRSYLGQLRFVAVAIPGSAGLFSALQLALNKASDARIRITRSLRQHVEAFASLAASLSQRPTQLAEIVPQEPSFLGATDAAKPGMGGIFYDADGQGYVWRHPFSRLVQDRLVSADNPSGTITNSDLEHAGVLAQTSLIAHTFDVRYATISTGTDNTPAVSRIRKGAVSSAGAAAHLCNYACQHQRLHRYCQLGYYIPGPANNMADDASRLQHLTDEAFLSHFQQAYPQPLPWKMLTLPLEISSMLNSALLSNTPLFPRLPNASKPKPRSSASGPASAKNSDIPLPSVTSILKKGKLPTSLSSASATDKEASRTDLYAMARFVPPFKQWARGSPTWVSRIHASSSPNQELAQSPPNEAETHYIPYSLLTSSLSKPTTTQQPEPTLSTPPSSVASMTPSTPITPNMGQQNDTSSTLSLSHSTGSSALRNTCTPAPNEPTKPVHKHSACVTSTSPSATASTTPSTTTCL